MVEEVFGAKKKNGYCKRVYDEEIKSIVLELIGTNVSTMYIEIPRNPRISLAVKLPFLVMLIKNMSKYFTFEVKVLDDQSFCRRFRISNFQNCTSIKTFCTSMPMGMSPGWNQIHFNLADFTRRAYGTSYMETVHLQVHANIRIRRIYFADRLYSEEELPDEYRLQARPKERARPKDIHVPSARPPSPVKSEKIVEKPVVEPEPAPAETGDEPLATEDGEGIQPFADEGTTEAPSEGGAPTATEPDAAAAVAEDAAAPVEEEAPKPAEEQFYFYY